MNDKSYFPWFDWLRAVCAIVVMLGHAGAITIPNAGNFAVQVFFAMSGWLIGRILLNTGSPELPRFYFNRAIRIWVPYYLGILLFLPVSLLRDPISSKWVEILLYKLTFVYNLFGTRQLALYQEQMPLKGTMSHFWSVNAEEQFYLLAPLLLVWISARWGRNRWLWAVLAAIAWYFDTYAAIVFGVLAALVVGNETAQPSRAPAPGLFCFGLIASSMALLAGIQYRFCAPVAALSIVMLLAWPGKQHRFGELWGGMSYPLYLNHWIGIFALNFLAPSLKGQGIQYLLSSALNIVFAMVLFRGIDRRLLAQRSRWYTPMRGMALMILAYLIVMIGIGFGLSKWV